jgi:hypothetical protein
MAVQGITTEGEQELFLNGWTSIVTWAKLYTDADVEVDEQTVTLVWDGTNENMKLTADVVFDVTGGTNNVEYVKFGYTSGSDIVVFTEIFSTLYDFSTTGTLTLDYGYFYISGTSISTAGEEELADNGFETIVTAKLYTTGSAVLLDTQTVSFTAESGDLSLDDSIVFDVASGIPYSIQLFNTGGDNLYQRVFDSAIDEFTTPGTLTVDTWVFSF